MVSRLVIESLIKLQRIHCRIKKSKLKSCLCDYSEAYILLKGIISVENTEAADADKNIENIKVILKIFLHLMIV